LDVLERRIEELLAGEMTALEVLLPYSRNDLVALWRQNGSVEKEEYVEEGVHISGKLPMHLLSQYTTFRIDNPKRRAAPKG
jgi:GTP-binding protein HflX